MVLLCPGLPEVLFYLWQKYINRQNIRIVFNKGIFENFGNPAWFVDVSEKERLIYDAI